MIISLTCIPVLHHSVSVYQSVFIACPRGKLQHFQTCVRLIVTLRYCVKTVKHIVEIIPPFDSEPNHPSSFLRTKRIPKFQQGYLQQKPEIQFDHGSTCTALGIKTWAFSEICAKFDWGCGKQCGRHSAHVANLWGVTNPQTTSAVTNSLPPVYM